jgi:tRNA threonylcarbamoyladenosine modification (KEOPS) complex  Pcc1 subunit
MGLGWKIFTHQSKSIVFKCFDSEITIEIHLHDSSSIKALLIAHLLLDLFITSYIVMTIKIGSYIVHTNKHAIRHALSSY